MKRYWILLLLIYNYANGQGKKPLPAYLELEPQVFSISLVMMHDVVDPPAASRYYMYCVLGAYEIAAQNNKSIIPLSSLVKNYTPALIATDRKKYDHRIAAAYCILETGKLMLPSGFMLQENEDKYINNLRKNKVSKAIIDSSVAVGERMAASIISFSKKDGYGKLSTLLNYTPRKGESYWYPTPPAYLEAVQPNWTSISTMFIDSCNQFVPLPAVSFSKDSASDFYRQAMEVYDVVKNITPDHLEIASFWDCNPFVVSTSGHMMLGFKKITPGGHWMNIAGIATKTARLNFDESVMVHAMVAITLFDGFISCWDEKYRSNRIRPETYINKYIDLHWTPVLQTPPFPEYTSGHSVISTAAAEVLSYLMGNQFTFYDNSEDLFDIKARTFHSFRQAAEEAAISRLYGGIHYRDAIVNGQTEGRDLGKFIIAKIKKAGVKPVVVSNATATSMRSF